MARFKINNHATKIFIKYPDTLVALSESDLLMTATTHSSHDNLEIELFDVLSEDGFDPRDSQ
jgi:hypothetical protein